MRTGVEMWYGAVVAVVAVVGRCYEAVRMLGDGWRIQTGGGRKCDGKHGVVQKMCWVIVPGDEFREIGFAV